MKVYGIRNHSAGELLAAVMGKEYGLSPLPCLEKTETGKPFFPDHPRLQFNLSDSGGYALCAVSSLPVGVDIEVVRPRKEELIAYALTEREQAEHRALGGGWPAFYALWTRKEAWAKYTGLGLSEGWQKDVPEKDLHFGAYRGEDWIAALCGEEPAPEDIVWLTEKDLL